jgi:hypothetical protein
MSFFQKNWMNALVTIMALGACGEQNDATPTPSDSKLTVESDWIAPQNLAESVVSVRLDRGNSPSNPVLTVAFNFMSEGPTILLAQLTQTAEDKAKSKGETRFASIPSGDFLLNSAGLKGTVEFNGSLNKFSATLTRDKAYAGDTRPTGTITITGETFKVNSRSKDEKQSQLAINQCVG